MASSRAVVAHVVVRVPQPVDAVVMAVAQALATKLAEACEQPDNRLHPLVTSEGDMIAISFPVQITRPT